MRITRKLINITHRDRNLYMQRGLEINECILIKPYVYIIMFSRILIYENVFLYLPNEVERNIKEILI
jgi:hypothetical protein